VVDLNVPLTLALAWRRNNSSPLLAKFIGEVQRLPDVRAVNNPWRSTYWHQYSRNEFNQLSDG